MIKSDKVNTYNKSEVYVTCSSLFGAAHAILDTSVVLATALGNDQTHATNMQNQINNKSDKLTTYVKTDIDVLICIYIYIYINIVKAGLTNSVLSNAVDSNGKVNITALQMKYQTKKVDGSILYDSLELSFNTVDKTSILKVHNIDVLASLALKSSASNAYTKQKIN